MAPALLACSEAPRSCRSLWGKTSSVQTGTEIAIRETFDGMRRGVGTENLPKRAQLLCET